MPAYGKLLHVDLTSGRIWSEPTEQHRLFIGGRGLNVALLLKYLKPGTDALSPENVLVFNTGPLTGTGAPAASRYNVSSHSPLSGFLGDSNSGGFWSAELKHTGYDGIVIFGRARQPVFLSIRDDKAELRDAADLWGRSTWETSRTIQGKLGDPQTMVASIGIAGENLVRFACVVNNSGRVAGRTGMGAVMGSKNLKAIAVRGTQSIHAAHPKEFNETCRLIREKIRHCRQFDLYKLSGVITHRGVEDYSDNNPTVSLLFNPPVPGWGELGGKEWWKTYWTKRKACFGCQMHCSHFFNVRNGAFAGTLGEGPDAETMGWLTALVGNYRKDFAAYGVTLLNKLGMDAIEMGGIIRGLMLCCKNGLLTRSKMKQLKLGWLKPAWGDMETVLSLIDLTSRREGIGDILANGPVALADAIGGDAHYWIDTCKGMSEINRSPQKGGVLNHMVSSRGIDHLRGSPSLEFYGYTGDTSIAHDWAKYVAEPELFNHATQLTSYKGKAPLVIWQEHLRALSDSFGVCSFNYGNWPNTPIYPEDFAELYTHATGIETSGADITRAGERILNLERAFNLREGLTRAHDQPPEKWVKEIKTSGLYKGEHTDIVQYNLMLDEYYRRRGWNKDGLPTRRKMTELGLDDLYRQLASIGKADEDDSV
jgi:aldehyde:ferredoxin oxidoreductase